MADEFTAVLPNDENIEIVEADYIIEEMDSSPVIVKKENDPNGDDMDIFSDGEESTQNLVSLEKDENTEQDLYHCDLCNITFSNSIESHLKEHHYTTSVEQYDENTQTLVTEVENEEAISSQEVDQRESDEFEITTDIKIETTDSVYQDCDYVFDNMQDAESHQSEAFDLNHALICNDCKAVFENEQDMKAHQCQLANIKEEHIASLFSCPECPKQFSSINLLQQHQKIHKTKNAQTKLKKVRRRGNTEKDVNEKYHCDICNTTFFSPKNLKLHSKMHLTIPMKTIKDAMPIGTDSSVDRKQFYCEICNKSFDHGLLSVHQNMHQNVEEHNCSICNRQFENQISYEMHMQLHTDQPTRPRTRTQHVAKTGAKFPCNYCGRDFFRPHEKVKHERIHTGEKPHECEVCGKSFRVSYSLTLHLRTHTDIRPFVCSQCNKRFKSYAVYTHHLNTHSEDRPYKCPMCPKSFRTSVQLCGHKNSHTKPYSCPECNRPFASLYAVKMHMKTHNKANKSNENLKHRCGICGAVYARMFALRFHMKEQHSTDVTENQDNDLEDNTKPPITADDCFNEDEVSTQAILQEEIIIDNFHTEEIVTDWLTHK